MQFGKVTAGKVIAVSPPIQHYRCTTPRPSRSYQSSTGHQRRKLSTESIHRLCHRSEKYTPPDRRSNNSHGESGSEEIRPRLAIWNQLQTHEEPRCSRSLGRLIGLPITCVYTSTQEIRSHVPRCFLANATFATRALRTIPSLLGHFFPRLRPDKNTFTL